MYTYGLTRQDFYRYLQLRDYFSKEIKGSDQKDMSALIKIFINAYNSGGGKGLVSKLYGGLMSMKKDSM